MLKWIARLGAGAGILLGLVLIAAITDFTLWRLDITRRIENDPDRKVATTALGDIEYAVVGEGVPLLVLHGAPGGYDQALIGADNAAENAAPAVMTIAVSRPGHLGTPLSSGQTPQQQADLYAALLDELEIDRVVVLASSAGGYSGLQFALRHPDRTTGLILSSAGVRTSPDEPADTGGFQALISDIWIWAAVKFFPAAIVPGFDADDPGQATELKAVMETTVPTALRSAGVQNDVVQAANPAIDGWPLEMISAPVLVVHGDADTFASYENARGAAAQIPNAELFTIEGGGHFAFPADHRRQIDTRIAIFIEEVAPS